MTLIIAIDLLCVPKLVENINKRNKNCCHYSIEHGE